MQNRLIDHREEDWTKLAEEHTCIYAQPMDTDNSGEGWGGGSVEEGKGGEMGDI